MHWIAVASTSSEVYGLLTWSSVLFPESKWNQGIEDGLQQVSATAHPQSDVVGPRAPVMAFKDQFHGEKWYLCPNLLPTFVEELLET